MGVVSTATVSEGVLNMGRLDEKVALITGAGSGIGRAGAYLFASEGARVAVVDCVATGGRETVRSIEESGGEATFVEADVSRAADVERMISRVMDTYGRLDILYNNAGIQGPVAPTAEVEEEDWDETLNINLKSAFLSCRRTIPLMLRQGGGVIINTSSTMGLGGKARIAPYCVSKAGIIVLTKTMAAEYARQNIRVNCICPGVIETPMGRPSIARVRMDLIPQGKAGQPEDVARAALYLASDDAAYVTGTVLVVDGGWTAEVMLPFKESALPK